MKQNTVSTGPIEPFLVYLGIFVTALLMGIFGGKESVIDSLDKDYYQITIPTGHTYVTMGTDITDVQKRYPDAKSVVYKGHVRDYLTPPK